MSELTPPSQEPKPIIVEAVVPEFKLRKEVVYKDFLKAGCTVAEAEELCLLIHATYI